MPTPTSEERLHPYSGCQQQPLISNHSPHARGGHSLGIGKLGSVPISIHSPYVRGRPCWETSSGLTTRFQSTPSTRGGDGSKVVVKSWMNGFQSTPPTREGDKPWGSSHATGNYFNPLPLREGETNELNVFGYLFFISIHSPCARGRQDSPQPKARANAFQSTPPARGGDAQCPYFPHRRVYFNPLPLREGETP